MSLRSTLTTLVGSFSSLRLGAICLGGAAVAGLLVVSGMGAGGCDSSGGSVVCMPGKTCQICDAYGCRPANPGVGGGATTSSSSAGGGVATGGSGSGATGGAGGSAPCDPSKAACPCDNGQCSGGKTCVNGLCIDGCNFTYECGAGDVCADGACVPGCDATHACGAGYTCVKGACQPDTANPQCSASQPCPSGQICGTDGICTTSCTATSQCATGDICDGASHTCIPNPSPKPVCGSTMPCAGNEVCLSDGFCHYPCTSVSQCKLIDNRFVACDTGVCKTEEEVNPQCTLTMPCPAGKSCISNTCL